MGSSEAWVPLFKYQVFFSCVSFSIIVPSIAPYLNRLGAPEYILGVAVAVYSLGEMIGSTVFGKWMSEASHASKRALLASIIVGAVGSILYVVADAAGNPWLVVVARLVSGVWTGGKMVVEQTYIGEAAAPDRTTHITSEVGVYAVLGFVVGPSIGALFAPVNFGTDTWRVDEYTAPGYFMFVLCVGMIFATATVFDPVAGYATAKPETPVYGTGFRDAPPGPDKRGLVILLICFFAHFYSFAIQETVTTPFVSRRFGWSQRHIDYLFAGVGVLSLITSLAVSSLARCCSDLALLVLSLVFGLVGSLLLIDEPLFPPLGTDRFLVGFAFITVAFPFGRNVALAMFSKILGPTPQGTWIGLMFVVGALPRCLGPSWSLYALRLACTVFVDPQPCPPGGRTCLEFALSGSIFAASLVLVFFSTSNLLPYDERSLRRYRRASSLLPPSPLASHSLPSL